MSHLDPNCAVTRHVPATFHMGTSNGHWGQGSHHPATFHRHSVAANSTTTAAASASTSAENFHRIRMRNNMLLQLNHHLADTARAQSLTAAHITGNMGATRSRYIPGRRCKDATRLPSSCYAGDYYPQSRIKYMLQPEP